MERIRLTKRASRERVADQATPETAIDLGKNRTYHKIDEYHTFKPSLNHWEPDMRHEWKDNPREETGHGIPKMAKVYMAAKKATKLASLFLGEKADDNAVERQARAFMRMGDRALTASLNLYAECKGEDCEQEAPAKSCNAKQEAAPAPAVEEAPAKACNAEQEAAPAPAPAVEEAPAKACNAEQEVAPAPAPAVDEAPAKSCNAEQEDAPAPAVEENVDVEVDDGLIDTTVDFDDVADGEDTTASAELEACFSAEDEGAENAAPAVDAPVAPRKAGVKKLAGQPTLVRVASKKADELAGLWEKWENPDIR